MTIRREKHFYTIFQVHTTSNKRDRQGFVLAKDRLRNPIKSERSAQLESSRRFLEIKKISVKKISGSIYRNE